MVAPTQSVNDVAPKGLNSDIPFSPAVKAAQAARGSRDGYARRLARRDFAREITPDLAQFLAERDHFYLSTASADGQPYLQHRGGDPGFVVVLDERTLAFADYAGNRQYITVGNLSENPRVALFFMDYPNRQRVKMWGRAWAVEGDDPALEPVRAASPGKRIERVIVVTVDAWDLNCRQHITPRYSVAEIEALAPGEWRGVGV